MELYNNDHQARIGPSVKGDLPNQISPPPKKKKRKKKKKRRKKKKKNKFHKERPKHIDQKGL